MGYSKDSNEQRQEKRVLVDLPAGISIGSQLTTQGQLQDVSLRSAFIKIKSSLYLQINEEVGFFIHRAPGDEEAYIQGLARISRIVPGEGIAVYFVAMDAGSTRRLKTLIEKSPPKV